MVQQINTWIASSSNSTPSTSIIPPSMDHDQTIATIVEKFKKK
jgi:3-polyprenyl-4-hydroxybenzoate decarboxylase